MNNTLKKLRKRKLVTSILLVVLIIFVIGLISILKPEIKKIKIKDVFIKSSSLNASVIDGTSEGVITNNYDEIKYKLKVNKESTDEAVITGTLKSKYARFKSMKNAEISEDGKSIRVTTTKEKVNVTVIIENAPYGETIKPEFKINSEDENKSKINVEPVVINGNSVEGQIKTEAGTLIEGIELSLVKDGEEVKRTYSKENGEYVFSLQELNNYEVRIAETKYKLVRYEEISGDQNKRVLDIVITEVEPFKLNIRKTISKLDLVINGNKQTFNYDDEEKVVKSIKNAKTIEGSIYYNIYIKNEGEVKGTLTVLKDVIPNGLSFDESKNPGWSKEGKNLFYTPLEGKEIESFGKESATLVLDIVKTNEAKTYINSITANGDDYKYVAYYLNNNIFKEEYVINSEKLEDINPGVENFVGWYTDRNYTNKYNFKTPVTKDTILFGKIENNKYNVTFVDINPNNNVETILDIKEVDEGESVELIDHPEYRGYTFKCFKLNNACYNNEEIIEDTTLYTSYTVNEYNITYDLDGGELSENNPSTYTIKDTFTLNNPSKEGYTFLGWTGTDLNENTLTVTVQEGSIGDRHYDAHFEINRYILTVDPNGGTYKGSTGTIDLENDYGTVITLDTPEKTGYRFTGWTLTGFGTLAGATYTYGLGNGRVTANYEPIEYQITYTLNGGTVSVANPTTYTIESPDITLNNPSKEGHTFTGWTGTGLSNETITVIIPHGSTGDREYTANFEINRSTLIVDPNGGSYEGNTSPTPYTEDYGTVMTIIDSERTGYTFTGYTHTGGGSFSNKVYTFDNDDGLLTATYEVIPYEIKYFNITDDERTALANPTSYNVETETFTLREPSTRVDGQGNPSEDFLGWDDGNGNVSKNVTITKGSTGDREYTAVWRENQNEYAITYELNGGAYETGKSNPSTYTRQSDPITLNNPHKDGYNFVGWSGTDLVGNTNQVVIIPTGSAGDRHYVANYEPIVYQIEYNGLLQGEDLNNPSTYTIESATITLNNPSRTGYTFDGWTGSNGDTASTLVTIPHGSMGDKEYTVNFTPIDYPIEYDLDGGTVSTANPTSYNIESDPITLNNPSKEGYKFIGWTGTDVDTATKVVTIPTGSIGARNYVANYEPIVYQIKYNGLLDGEDLGNPTSYTIESATITLNNPNRASYNFLGWTGSNGNTPSVNVTIPHGSTGDKEYTVNFETISYSITYTLNGGEYDDGVSNPGSYTIESPDILLNNPHKDGYTFKGWTGTEVDTASTSVTIAHGSTGHRSYLANYDPIVYNITYDYDGGALQNGETNPSTYTIETPDIIFNNPVKEGYNFMHYKDTSDNSIVTGIPTGSMGDKDFKAYYEIKRYTVTYHNEDVIHHTESNIPWNTTISAPSNPEKAHHIFLYWSEDHITEFDFVNTYIKENRDLYAVYEEVLAPVITYIPTLDDTTNRTWVCGDSSNDACGVTVTITNNPALIDTTGYTLYYKIGDGSAVEYTGPFPVYENVEIKAFAKKSDIYSTETVEEIVNVDTIAPTINQPSTGAMSFNMTVRGVAQDASSGVKQFT